MLFEDDIILVGESLEEVNNGLEKWGETFEGKGLRIIKSKKYIYIEFEFGVREEV